jgi:hypothetical protein
VTFSGSGLQGVTVTLSGASSATMTTDSSGSFSFNNLANGDYTVIPSKTGYAFNLASSVQTVNNANITNINFTAMSFVWNDNFENYASGQFPILTDY